MRFIIIGAGAVGGTIGGRLFQSGHDVVLVARGAHLEAIRADGLALHSFDEVVTLPVPAVPGPDEVALEPDDVLVCAVKSQDTAAVLEAWADRPVRSSAQPASWELPFVVAQNGVANEDAALRFFRHVYPMCVWLPASYLEAGTIHAQGWPNSGLLTVGKVGGRVDAVSAALVTALAASRFVAVEDAEVMRWKYGKLLSNLRNGLEAVCGSGPETTDLAAELRREGEAVLLAAGVDFSSPAEEAARRGDSVQLRPPVGSPRVGSSTWQSLARGTGSTEVDYLNGEVAMLGRRHGIATPANDAVQQAAHLLQRERRSPGAFDVADLSMLVRGAAAAGR